MTALNIVYEDADIVVLNKPAGTVVHPDKTHKENTLIQQLIKIRPEIVKVGPTTGPDDTVEADGRPGIVHRLDKDTSGLLLIAKNSVAFSYYKNFFKAGKISKTYAALVEGMIKKDSDVINISIGRSRRDPRVRVASKKAFGKLREAKTEFKVTRRFANYTLLEVRPLTGRTHQIRAHMKVYGHPVVCDTLYNRRATCPAGLQRHFLHATKLKFATRDGRKLKLVAELPEDLKSVLKMLGDPISQQAHRST